VTLAPGQTVGGYQILEQIGRGGMATVFKAYQTGLQRFVAIKALPAFYAEDPAFRERFLAPHMFDPLTSSPEQFAEFLKSETRKWGKVIRDANLKAD